MKKALLFFSIILFFNQFVTAQKFAYVYHKGFIKRLHLSPNGACMLDTVMPRPDSFSVFDLACHPNGLLYGCGDDNKLSSLNLTTGEVTYLGKFK